MEYLDKEKKILPQFNFKDLGSLKVDEYEDAVDMISTRFGYIVVKIFHAFGIDQGDFWFDFEDGWKETEAEFSRHNYIHDKTKENMGHFNYYYENLNNHYSKNIPRKPCANKFYEYNGIKYYPMGGCKKPNKTNIEDAFPMGGCKKPNKTNIEDAFPMDFLFIDFEELEPFKSLLAQRKQEEEDFEQAKKQEEANKARREQVKKDALKKIKGILSDEELEVMGIKKIVQDVTP